MALDYNFITGLQKDMAAMLASDEALQHVNVIREAPRERSGGVVFEDAVNRALDTKTPTRGKVGLAVIIFSPEGKPETRANSGLTTNFEIPVRVVENPSLNTSKDHGVNVPCEDMLVEVMLLLQNWTPLRGHPLRVADFYKVTLDKQPHLWAWECLIEAKDHQTPRPKCGLPVIDMSETIVTVTTATADARLFYSLDGSLPTPETGIEYESPFDLTSSATVRAMAYAPGYMPSDCANLTA